MKIYYNIATQNRCDKFGIVLVGNAPLICFKQQPEWTLNLLNDNGVPFDLTGIESFRAAVDVDFTHTTAPVIRSLDQDIDHSQKSRGILKISLNANTVNFQQAVDGALNKKAYFELWGLDQNAKTKLYVMFEIRLSSVIDPDGGELPEEVPSDYMTTTRAQAILRAADEHQFTRDPDDENAAHIGQTEDDTYFRYRNSAAQSEWSPWIKLPVGVQGPAGADGKDGQNGQNGTDGKDGQNGANGITPHIGENGNWFLAEQDTGVAAAGSDGKDGQNGQNGANGKDGITPHIGDNGNWYLADHDTGVAANAEAMFMNGIPPFEFTNADLSNGILSKTFAEMGVSSRNLVAVNIISGEGVIMDGDVRLAMIWTDTGLKVDFTQFGTISGTWKLVFAGGSTITGGGDGSGNGYVRTIITADSNAMSGYWYICTNALTLTLPAGNVGDYVRISTNYQTDHVLVIPASGKTIDGDVEGFTLDKTSGTVEFFWTGVEWTVIEAK